MHFSAGKKILEVQILGLQSQSLFWTAKKLLKQIQTFGFAVPKLYK